MWEGPPLCQPWEWLGEGCLGCLVPGRKPGARAVMSTGQEGLLRAERGQDFWGPAEAAWSGVAGDGALGGAPYTGAVSGTYACC